MAELDIEQSAQESQIESYDDSVDSDIGWDCGSQYYELLERVGRGAFAEVFAARCSSGKRQGTGVAIKVRCCDVMLYFSFFSFETKSTILETCIISKYRSSTWMEFPPIWKIFDRK